MLGFFFFFPPLKTLSLSLTYANFRGHARQGKLGRLMWTSVDVSGRLPGLFLLLLGPLHLCPSGNYTSVIWDFLRSRRVS